jgi:hypothetical protein
VVVCTTFRGHDKLQDIRCIVVQEVETLLNIILCLDLTLIAIFLVRGLDETCERFDIFFFEGWKIYIDRMVSALYNI